MKNEIVHGISMKSLQQIYKIVHGFFNEKFHKFNEISVMRLFQQLFHGYFIEISINRI
jgi:hypothetical protein